MVFVQNVAFLGDENLHGRWTVLWMIWGWFQIFERIRQAAA